MKHSKPHRREVCMMCRKPSKQSICEPCKTKVHGETVRKKMQTQKTGKES